MFLPVEFSSAKGSMSYNPCQFDVKNQIELEANAVRKTGSSRCHSFCWISSLFACGLPGIYSHSPVLLPGRQP